MRDNYSSFVMEECLGWLLWLITLYLLYANRAIGEVRRTSTALTGQHPSSGLLLSPPTEDHRSHWHGRAGYALSPVHRTGWRSSDMPVPGCTRWEALVCAEGPPYLVKPLQLQLETTVVYHGCLTALRGLCTNPSSREVVLRVCLQLLLPPFHPGVSHLWDTKAAAVHEGNDTAQHLKQYWVCYLHKSAMTVPVSLSKTESWFVWGFWQAEIGGFQWQTQLGAGWPSGYESVWLACTIASWPTWRRKGAFLIGWLQE